MINILVDRWLILVRQIVIVIEVELVDRWLIIGNLACIGGI